MTGDAPASAIHLASRFGAFDRRILDSRRARSVMVDLGTTALRFVQLYGPLALLVFTFLEASMLFPFLPSEVVVPAAAVLVQDAASFVVFVGAAGVGGTVGAFVPYYVFRGPGSRGTGRLGEYLHVSERSKERARRWFLEWGVTSVLWGRFLPGLRSVISIPAGLVGMNAAWFGALTAIGTVAFYASVGALVYYAQESSVARALRVVAADRPWLVALLVLGVLAATMLLTRRYRRTRSRRSSR
ncbi:DedA family protein [Halalkalicoccus sp. GCM10025322]|uniref:DedA family protein n=1 Tax=Halalkalicoccus sp. GCM10025322 TaxID=3252661 RepID=UPI003619B81C